MLETIKPRWTGLAIVAATGPSLTQDVATACRGYNVIAVNDAYKLLPFAPVMYACDATWWTVHNGCPGFSGEKWSSHGDKSNKKDAEAKRYGLKLIAGKKANGFSLDPSVIHYGNNSGFQACNLAILFGATKLVLVGFDMRQKDGKQHFFGSHKAPLRRSSSYSLFIDAFKTAAKTMPAGVEIINATPGSALKCFPQMSLEDALDGSGSCAKSGTCEVHQDVHVA